MNNRISLAILCFAFLVTGCAIKHPQTAAEFRKEAPGATFGSKQSFEVKRSISRVSKTFKKMAVKTKRTQLGNYIAKVNGYDIRQKVSMKKGTKNPQVASSEYIVCRGGKMIEGGFKNKETASDYAKNH